MHHPGCEFTRLPQPYWLQLCAVGTPQYVDPLQIARGRVLVAGFVDGAVTDDLVTLGASSSSSRTQDASVMVCQRADAYLIYLLTAID